MRECTPIWAEFHVNVGVVLKIFARFASGYVRKRQSTNPGYAPGMVHLLLAVCLWGTPFPKVGHIILEKMCPGGKISKIVWWE